ncbi:hypothetical protein T06_10785, partial [Trichinella sp. T6]
LCTAVYLSMHNAVNVRHFLILFQSRVSTRKKYESLQQLLMMDRIMRKHSCCGEERSRRRHEAELKMKGKCDSPWPQFLMYWARDTSKG